MIEFEVGQRYRALYREREEGIDKETIKVLTVIKRTKKQITVVGLFGDTEDRLRVGYNDFYDCEGTELNSLTCFAIKKVKEGGSRCLKYT